MTDSADTHDYRQARIGELAVRARKALKLPIPILAVATITASIVLFVNAESGGVALLLIGLSACFALMVWRGRGAGLPLMPMIILQHVLVYGLPLIASRDTLAVYSDALMTKAGVEVLFFLLALAAAWRAGMTLLTPGRPVCYALRDFNKGGTRKLGTIGFSLISGALLYQIVERSGMVDTVLSVLPGEFWPVIWAVISAGGVCGSFIVSLLMGGGAFSVGQRLVFWLILTAFCYIASSSFLLSSAILMLITVMVGFFWSSGRIPWIYLFVVFVIFSFLNVGKVVMRERYWGDRGADNIPEFPLTQIPEIYAEWAEASYDCITGDNITKQPTFASSDAVPEQQTLLKRVNNMQNLLFVIDAVETNHVELLHGQTYSIIPMLLIPRFIWPEKPRTHEGQVILNVHFGRQDLMSTETTYIAWGILPEAYGNFGPFLGAVIVGCFLGFVFAWVEQHTVNKLVISVEGFVAFVVFLSLADSFEFVASVLVTSLEQSIIPIVAATAFFARRTVLPPRTAPKA